MRGAIAVLVLIGGVAAAAAQDRPADWKGELVVGKKYAEDIAFGSWVNEKYESYPFRGIYPIAVRADKEGWLRVFDGHREGWVKKDDFVLSKDAPAYFTDRIRADPKDDFAWWSRGCAWSDRGEYDIAIKDFDECIRLNPRDASAYNARGECKRMKEDWPQALKDYDEAIRLDPKCTTHFNNRGLVRWAQGDIDRALNDIEEAQRLDPKWILPVVTRAKVLLASRRPGAVQGCRKALELDGRTGTVRATDAVIVGSLAARFEKDDTAAKSFLRDSTAILKEDWPQPVVRFLRGELDETALLKLATDRDKETEARTYLGLDHVIRGNQGAARAHFRWVKDNGTRFYTAYTIAIAELARLEKGETPKR